MMWKGILSKVLVTLLVARGTFLAEEANMIMPKTKLQMQRSFSLETYNLLIFFDSQSLQNQELVNTFKLLMESKYLIDNFIQVITVDFQNIPTAVEDYHVQREEISMIFYIRGFSFVHPNFDAFIHSHNKASEIAEEITQFMERSFNGLTKEVSSFADFEKLLNKEKRVVIYLGLKNTSFKIYRNLSLEYPEKQFYHSVDKVLNYKILRKYSDKAIYDLDIIGVFKAKEEVSDVDDKQFQYFNHFYNHDGMVNFLDMEIFPKLRDNSYADHNVTYFFKAKDPHMLLLIKDKESPAKYFEEYKVAVSQLPRKWIYAYTDLNLPESAKYIQLFDMHKVQWRANAIYMIHRTLSEDIEIVEMQDQITKPNIVHFVFQLIQEKHQAFVDEKHDEDYEIDDL